MAPGPGANGSQVHRSRPAGDPGRDDRPPGHSAGDRADGAGPGAAGGSAGSLPGDYVTLSYDFSRVSRDSVQGLSERDVWDSRKTEGRPVYVTLVPDSDRVHWRAGKYTLAKPDGGLFLKGQMGRYGSLQFGIESYFVQEGSGHMYERAIREHKLSAELAVTSSGQAALRSLRIE